MKTPRNARTASAVLLYCLLGSALVANADSFSFEATDTPLNIPPTGTEGETISEITVAPGTVPGAITDLNVYVDLDHAWTGDLDIFLKHVDTDTEVLLFFGDGSSEENMREVMFDDNGSNGSIGAASAPYGPGSFVPIELLGTFNGESVEGTWQLRIVDKYDGELGTLYTFAIEGDTLNVSAPDIADGDNDGVMDDGDLCPGTVIPESVPTRRLNPNRFALMDGDLTFDTLATTGESNRGGFTIGDTAGCSCEQIIALMGLGYGHEKFGCTAGVIKEWIKTNAP